MVETMGDVQKIALGFYSIDRGLRRFAKVFAEMEGAVESGNRATAAIGGHAQEQLVSLEESIAVVREVHMTAGTLNEIMGKVSRDAENGLGQLKEMGRLVSGINGQMEGMVSRSNVLSEKADEMKTAIQSISGIAEQTNLLALPKLSRVPQPPWSDVMKVREQFHSYYHKVIDLLNESMRTCER